MANAGGPMDLNGALPPWLRSVLTIVLQHGVSAAIALWFVWFISQQMTADLRQMAHELRQHDARAQLAGRAMVEFAADQQKHTEAIIYLMRQTCINTARSYDQRRECSR